MSPGPDALGRVDRSRGAVAVLIGFRISCLSERLSAFWGLSGFEPKKFVP
jgi:hypothetical protein